MSLHCLLFLTTALLIGCTAQRDSAEANDDAEGTMEIETTRDGGMPNVAVYPYGAWDFTATQIGGDETFTGTLTLAEAQGASRIMTSDGIDAPLLISELDQTNANFVLSGVIESGEGPIPFSMAGSLSGDEMSAEAELEERGTYALTGVRHGG